MLSLFSKSSRHLETSNDGTRSCVGARHVSRERRHVSRGRRVSHLRALFSSDVEGEREEVTSVVSDNPGLYSSLSTSMSVLPGSNVRAKKHLLRSRRTFDTVERKMSRIETSLGSSGSVTNLPTRGQVSQEPPSSIHSLRSQLEQQSAQLKRLHDDLTLLKLSEHSESNCVAELETQVIRRRKQMNKKRDQLKRIQYDGKIDAMISLAEIEFSMEKDQVEMLSLSQRIKELKAEECKIKRDCPKQESLFSLIPENKKMVLVTRTLDRKQIMAGVRMRREGAGLELISDHDNELMTGVRVIEVNGQSVLRIQEVS